jgi:hypothetical protein
MTYLPAEILNAVDANKPVFLATGGLALAFNYAYFFSAFLAAKRDRVFTFPLVCSTIWFAHDLSFVLAHDTWFGVYHHWYLQGFWYGLVVKTLFELGFIYQTWIYGKEEILPRGSQQLFNGFILLTMAAGIVAWWSLKQFLDDPIYTYAFGATGLIAPLFVIARMARRGDAKGQSVLVWASYCGMQSCWYIATILLFGPAFRKPTYLAMCVLSVGAGLVAAILCHRLRGRSNL